VRPSQHCITARLRLWARLAPRCQAECPSLRNFEASKPGSLMADVCDLTDGSMPAAAGASPDSSVIILDDSGGEDEAAPSPRTVKRGTKRRAAVEPAAPGTAAAAAAAADPPGRATRRAATVPAAPRGVIDLTSETMKVSVIGALTETAPRASASSRLAPVAQEPPKWTCSICLDEMREMSSTTCGHLFCKGCIKQAVKSNKRCPQCRKKLTQAQIHRIYLPHAGSADASFPRTG
jgi:hypothetical protein